MPETGPLSFTKMQAVGNDFVVLAAYEWPGDTDWSATTIRLCDRRFGIGSDGLMLWDTSDKADLRARMWNPDGTEDMCGNGTRCVLHLAYRTGKIPAEGTVETLAGVLPYHVNSDGTVTVEMGVPRFRPHEVPFDPSHQLDNGKFYGVPGRRMVFVTAPDRGAIGFHPVNTGSTHAVTFQFTPDDDCFFLYSPLTENHLLFPERTSVMWARPEGRNTLRIRIWERGVGETLGCGTGACAAAVVARETGEVEKDGDITVHSKGGTLRVGWSGGENDPMYLTGTAHITYAGVVYGEG